MVRAADTSPEADAVQVEAYRRLGGAGRVAAAFRMSELSRQAAEAGIRRRHPEYGEDEVRQALLRLLHGDELVQRAWPGRALVEP